MRRRRLAALALLTVAVCCAAFTMGRVSAQATIPNGVFVRESSGLVWLILEGQRVIVPFWNASDEQIQAIPTSGRAAVMNDTGAIVAGELPAWITGMGPEVPVGSPTTVVGADPSPTAPPPVRAIPLNPAAFTTPPGVLIPPEPGRGFPIPGVAGQQAIGTALLSDERFRATVRSMLAARALSSTVGLADARFFDVDEQWPAGIFIIVEVEVENIGTKPSPVLPAFRLRDARGRYFSGKTSDGESEVKAARFWFYSDIPWTDYTDDYQPNLPKRRVFVYDVPTDATGLMLSPDQFTR